MFKFELNKFKENYLKEIILIGGSSLTIENKIDKF